MKSLGFIGILIICSFGQLSFGQQELISKNEFKIGTFYGNILPEYQHFNYLVQSPIYGLEASWINRKNDTTFWNQLYKYPEYGLNLRFQNLGNKEVFGFEYAIVPFFKTFFNKSVKYKIFNQFGLGIGYATKKFDVNQNNLNVAVGSHINVHFSYQLGFQFKLNENIKLSSGFAFEHFSNANMAEPNLGINSVLIFLNSNWQTGKQFERKNFKVPNHLLGHHLFTTLSFGGKHTRALQSLIYFTSSLSVTYRFDWKRKFKLNTGLDAFYDSSTYTEMSNENKANYQPFNDFKVGIHFAPEIQYKNLFIVIQQGIYLGQKNKVNGKRFYNRVAMRYEFSKHFMVQVGVKSHLHILDFPEIGFGYRFL